jgi:RNA polymerase sigma factor (sigma-70 family)
MDQQEWLAERFEEHRTHLRAVAYRMLGPLPEADDAVQHAWLRLSRADTSEVENLGGWLTTVVARASLNMLRSRRSRREEPWGPRLPEPIVDRADGTDPQHEALLADSVGLALLVVLDTLTPAERLAFVLHDMTAERRRLGGRSGSAERPRSLAAHSATRGSICRRSRRSSTASPAPSRPATSVGCVTVRGGKIVEIDIVADPARLSGIDVASLAG